MQQARKRGTQKLTTCLGILRSILSVEPVPPWVCAFNGSNWDPKWYIKIRWGLMSVVHHFYISFPLIGGLDQLSGGLPFALCNKLQ